MTQKQMLAAVKDYAADLGHKATVRKEANGDYVARLVANGSRFDGMIIPCSSFADACESLTIQLENIADEQYRIGLERAREHDKALAEIVRNFAGLFSSLGLTLFMRDHVVTMHSPKTGNHSLDMTFGNRPVSDLIPHLCGFVEAQSHRFETAEDRRIREHLAASKA
jgi:hypothetical protein